MSQAGKLIAMPNAMPDTPNTPESLKQLDRVMAAKLRTRGLNSAERAWLAAAQIIYQRFRGCTTPFEAFVWKQVFHVGHGRWPTPDDVAEDLEEFRNDFEEMREAARRYRTDYSR